MSQLRSATMPRTAVAFDFERKAFYTPAEVAEILHISDQTVLERIHEGKLYAVRLGPRLYRVPLGSLMQFLGHPARITRRLHPGARVDPRSDRPKEAAEH